jgi:hypothetical protein
VTPKIQEMVDRFENPVTTSDSSESSAPRMDDSPELHNQSDDGVEAKRPPIDLDRYYPRVAMTPSMLYTHASMRGKCDREGDPVHYALFPALKRSWGAGQIWIPMIEERGSMEE